MPGRKRVSMKGMGADAFFGPPAAQEIVAEEESEEEVSTPVQRDTSIPVQKDTGVSSYIKASYYISSEHDLKLERIRLRRRERGQKIDKSALVREAIERLAEE